MWMCLYVKRVGKMSNYNVGGIIRSDTIMIMYFGC